MCLPLRFLTICLKVLTCFQVVAGLILLAQGSVVVIHKKYHPNEFRQVLAAQSNIAIGGTIGIIGIFGMIAVWRGKKCWNTIYVISQICLCCSMLSSAVYFLTRSIQTGKQLKFDEFLCIDENCQENQQAVEIASATFCTILCKCYISPSSFPNVTNITQQFANLTYTTTNDTGSPPIINFEGCPSLYTSTVNANVTRSLGQIEQAFQCAGWEKASTIFLFSDINSGLPHSSCLRPFYESLITQGYLVAVVSFIVALLVFTAVVFALQMAYHPDKRTKNKRYYEYIHYFDD